jgi:hypothetical protein
MGQRLVSAMLLSHEIGNRKGLPEGSPFLEAKEISAIGDIHRHFESKPHFGVFRFSPHGCSPNNLGRRTAKNIRNNLREY